VQCLASVHLGQGGPAPVASTPPATHGNPVNAAIAQMKREEKRTDGAELDPGRASVAASAIVGAWGRGSGSAFKVEDYRTATTSVGHLEGSGEGEVFRFDGKGTYKITHTKTVNQSLCQTQAVEFEDGSYTFDGTVLTLHAKSMYGVYAICHGKPTREDHTKKIPPRKIEIGFSDDGRLVMVGPACGMIEDWNGGCPAHARWELRKQ
jgi:hypothetical protein